uniref:Galactose oxidase/kelch repeat superfamily protein n=1 Tax=Davidia involucrata TaxID=16924 RepID=A0A5B7AT89_DAVIN
MTTMPEEQIWPPSPFLPGGDKTLYMCFEGIGDPPKSYAIRSVKADELFTSSFSSSSPPPPPLEDVFYGEDHSFCLGMHCGKLGSKIYFVGGQIPRYMDPDYRTPDGGTANFTAYSLHNYSSSVFVFDIATRSFDTSSVTPLQMGKPSPLVVEVEGKLYVLSGIPVDCLNQPAFEAYDPVTNSWEKLACPPFLDPECKYFQDPKYTGYAVIGKKIHATTSKSSFTYDVKDDSWVPCGLFDGVPGDLHQPWEDPICYVLDFYGSRNDQTPCGPPFGFDGQAVLFGDDVLICVVPSELQVVAHRVLDGKVVQSQSILELPDHATAANLADFGQGFFCLVVTVFRLNDDDHERKSTVSLIPFMVKSVGTDLKDHFLASLVGKPFSYTFKFEDPSVDKIWFPIGCFAM